MLRQRGFSTGVISACTGTSRFPALIDLRGKGGSAWDSVSCPLLRGARPWLHLAALVALLAAVRTWRLVGTVGFEPTRASILSGAPHAYWATSPEVSITRALPSVPVVCLQAAHWVAECGRGEGTPGCALSKPQVRSTGSHQEQSILAQWTHSSSAESSTRWAACSIDARSPPRASRIGVTFLPSPCAAQPVQRVVCSILQMRRIRNTHDPALRAASSVRDDGSLV
jgi:hypothetical protein